MDAFSGDSIPVHLITQEAFKSYFRHLDVNGILAVHISNNYLNLRPIVADIAAEFGKSALLVESDAISKHYVAASEWILITDDKNFLHHIEHTSRGELLRRSGNRLWTDQYSNLLSVLKLTPRSR